MVKASLNIAFLLCFWISILIVSGSEKNFEDRKPFSKYLNKEKISTSEKELKTLELKIEEHDAKIKNYRTQFATVSEAYKERVSALNKEYDQQIEQILKMQENQIKKNEEKFINAEKTWECLEAQMLMEENIAKQRCISEEDRNTKHQNLKKAEMLAECEFYRNIVCEQYKLICWLKIRLWYGDQHAPEPNFHVLFTLLLEQEHGLRKLQNLYLEQWKIQIALDTLQGKEQNVQYDKNEHEVFEEFTNATENELPLLIWKRFSENFKLRFPQINMEEHHQEITEVIETSKVSDKVYILRELHWKQRVIIEEQKGQLKNKILENEIVELKTLQKEVENENPAKFSLRRSNSTKF